MANNNNADYILGTKLPESACAQEQKQFQRGLEIMAELLQQQNTTTALPVAYSFTDGVQHED